MNTKTMKNKTLGIFLSLALVLSLVAVALPATPVQAATLLVGPTRTYTTISAAITAAADGDTITVDAGTYTEDLYLKPGE